MHTVGQRNDALGNGTWSNGKTLSHSGFRFIGHVKRAKFIISTYPGVQRHKRTDDVREYRWECLAVMAYFSPRGGGVGQTSNGDLFACVHQEWIAYCTSVVRCKQNSLR